MDGASRFTQRDAIASILITAINILAGFLIGVLQNGMDLLKALSTYTVLTIGDGLVTVIPALMVSVSGGMIVARASSDDRLGQDVQRQLFQKSQPLLLASGVLTFLAALPGLPTLPFLILGGSIGYYGWRLKQQDNAAVASTPTEKAGASEATEPVTVEALTLELGLGLVRSEEHTSELQSH